MNTNISFNDLEMFTDNLRKQRHISALTRIKINRVRNIRSYLLYHNLLNPNLGVIEALIHLRSHASNDVYLRKSLSDVTMGATPSDARFIREGDPRIDPYEEGYTLLDDMDLETIDMLIEFAHIIKMTLVHADAQQKERDAAEYAYNEMWHKGLEELIPPKPKPLTGKDLESSIEDDIKHLRRIVSTPNSKQSILDKMLGKLK